MWSRVWFLVLINSASVFAQTVPNFSGVFLETETRGHYRTRAWSQQPDAPLVLEIEQNFGALRLREWQNGSQAIHVYNLDGDASINASPDGRQTRDRVRFEDGSLVTRSEVVGNRENGEVSKETWSLSPDLRTLTMEPGFEPRGNAGISLFISTEIYARQTTLEAALEKAARISRMNNCVPSQRYPVKHARDISYGIPLGDTDFRQLGWTETFNSFLAGEFFTNLKLMPTPGGVECRRDKKLVSNYSGSLTLTVLPATRKEPRWVGSNSSMIIGGWRFTDALKDLRFHILWVGSDSRDLGEVPAELKTSSFAKGFPLEGAYTMKVPADNVPITDSLEVHILSSSGTQLGCIRGQI
jgi:hypothetical protein